MKATPPLTWINHQLAPLGRRIIRVRARSGVLRFVICPGLDLLWPTLGEAWRDLRTLRVFDHYQCDRWYCGSGPDLLL